MADVNQMALPPCHSLFQFYVAEGKLSCQLYQRSADTFLGVPFNIASYALLTMMIAQVCDLKVGDFIHTLGDTHLYLNHIDQAVEYLSRTNKPLPRIELEEGLRISKKMDDRRRLIIPQIEDIQIKDYHPHPLIKAELSVGK